LGLTEKKFFSNYQEFLGKKIPKTPPILLSFRNSIFSKPHAV